MFYLCARVCCRIAISVRSVATANVEAVPACPRPGTGQTSAVVFTTFEIEVKRSLILTQVTETLVVGVFCILGPIHATPRLG